MYILHIWMVVIILFIAVQVNHCTTYLYINILSPVRKFGQQKSGSFSMTFNFVDPISFISTGLEIGHFILLLLFNLYLQDYKLQHFLHKVT